MKLSQSGKTFTIITLFLAVLFSMLLCTPSANAAKVKSPPSALANTVKGQVLYTQFSLFHEKYRHRTTNYRKGVLVPVNTPVKFVRYDSTGIVVTLPDEQGLIINNVEKYSGETIEGIFDRTFGLKPVDLSKFTALEKTNIMTGEITEGMRKAAVIVAYGYPPKHQTPNLEMNEWRYWRNLFVTSLVIFEKDKIIRIE